MKRFIRTLTVVGTAAVAFGGFVPAAHADDGTSSAGSVPDTIEQLVSREVVGIGGNTCVPSKLEIDFADPPTNDILYGMAGMFYHWQEPAVATAVGCPHNTVTIRVQLTDQALDGASPPTRGDIKTATDKGTVGAVAELWVDYPPSDTLGITYHALTVVATASQTDNKTTTANCKTETWTYIPTVAGPHYVGSTGPQKCGS